MIDRQRAVYTQSNNVLGTINVLYAIKVSCGVTLPMIDQSVMFEFCRSSCLHAVTIASLFVLVSSGPAAGDELRATPSLAA